jgi:ribosome-associated toxin RatA of RatAB toxin-antitoxin module
MCVDALELSTVVYAPPREVYDFLREFTAYEQYSDYVKRVRRSGDGDVGSAYEITVQWWRLSYTVTPRVTDLDPPQRIDWRVVDRVQAEGYWAVEPLPEEDVPDDRDCATRARLRIEFVQSSLSNGVSGLPPLVPFDRILSRVTPVAKREIDAVFRRAVADLEGEERDVEVEYHRKPDVLARR